VSKGGTGEGGVVLGSLAVTVAEGCVQGPWSLWSIYIGWGAGGSAGRYPDKVSGWLGQWCM